MLDRGGGREGREGYTRAVSGWRLGDAASGAIDSALDAALCTLHSEIRTLHSVLCLFKVGLTVLGRPGDGMRGMKDQGQG